MKIINEVDAEYWVEVLHDLRELGDFKKADELREMLRRMGYEVRLSKLEK